MSAVHIYRHCPYHRDGDVWLIEFTRDGVGALLDHGLEFCQPCLAVVNSPPMLKANGDDDGRMTWHIHVLLRQALRHSMWEQGYERVVTDGLTERWRGPSAVVTIEWNDTWDRQTERRATVA